MFNQPLCHGLDLRFVLAVIGQLVQPLILSKVCRVERMDNELWQGHDSERGAPHRHGEQQCKDSKGIIQKLNDEELEAVFAHELTHIRNRDVRLLIVSIVFVGIFSMLTQITFYTITHARIRSNGKNGGGAILIILIALVIAAVGYFFASLMRFAISRKREYMADAGSAEMTKNPLALASALRKISDDPDIEAVKRGDVAQLFIQNPGDQSKSALSGLSGLFATHPPIEKRISILEQF